MDRDEIKIATALVLVLILIFSVFIGLYLSSLSPTGQTYTVTLNSFHDDVYIYFYNPLLVGQSIVNQGNTEFQLPEGDYTIKAELQRGYTADIVWTKSFKLNCDLEVKLFQD